MVGDGALDAGRLEGSASLAPDARRVVRAARRGAPRPREPGAQRHPDQHLHRPARRRHRPEGARAPARPARRGGTERRAGPHLARRGRGRARSTQEPFLIDTWDALVGSLPKDWSDLYVELTLDSSDYLEPAALAIAPINPSRWRDTTAFRFRCARRFGYGASPEMVRRCMERLDERGLTGSLRSCAPFRTRSPCRRKALSGTSEASPFEPACGTHGSPTSPLLHARLSPSASRATPGKARLRPRGAKASSA